MNEHLTILMIEDSEDDEILLRRLLNKAGHEFSLQRVENESEIKKQLTQGNWSIVISDFNLAGFNGLDALRWVREINQDVPFILISGTVGEETAVLAMKSGANDYLMKDNLVRLVPVIAREIQEANSRRARRDVELQLTFHASHDPLTGLFNRREFERHLDEFLADAKENKRQHVMLYMDLDQFKIINDTCGHVAGDALLRQLCGVLQNLIRTVDDILARLGGDEFGVLLHNCSEERGLRIADHIRDTVQKFLFEWQTRVFNIGISIGMVMITPESESTSQILAAADRACYSAKESGRNQVRLYRQDDNETSQRSIEMQWALRIPEALRRNRFKLYSQAIVRVDRAAQPRGQEILLRMVDESNQLIFPDRFIPAAERYDLMPSVDRWVIKNALHWLNSQNSPPAPGSFFCINLSGRSIADPKFLDFLLEQIKACTICPSHICFEITETATIGSMANATRMIETLRERGCQFSLDDFGSGLCSFNYLKSLPVDSVKIDGSFVKNITTDKVARSIVFAINNIAQAMGMETIAEFVEDAEILEVLREIGVDYAQGYYFERPKPLSEV